MHPHIRIRLTHHTLPPRAPENRSRFLNMTRRKLFNAVPTFFSIKTDRKCRDERVNFSLSDEKKRYERGVCHQKKRQATPYRAEQRSQVTSEAVGGIVECWNSGMLEWRTALPTWTGNWPSRPRASSCWRYRLTSLPCLVCINVLPVDVTQRRPGCPFLKLPRSIG